MHTDQVNESSAIEQLGMRLNRLESRERRWRVVAALAVAAAGVPWIIGAGFQPAAQPASKPQTAARPVARPAAQPATPAGTPTATPATAPAATPAGTPAAAVPAAPASTDLRGTSFTLVGADGAEYAYLKLDKGSPVLLLRQGDRYAMVTLADANAGVACGGPGGVTFAGVSATGAYFNARGNDQQAGVYAGVDEKLNTAFRAYGSDMKVAASLDVTSTGTPSLTLNDPKSGTTQLPSPR